MIIRSILQGIQLLQDANIVHCDLKPDNILACVDPNTRSVKSVKLIDLGSAVQFNQLNQQIIMTTPEYLPPEVLEINMQTKVSANIT